MLLIQNLELIGILFVFGMLCGSTCVLLLKQLLQRIVFSVGFLQHQVEIKELLAKLL